MTAQPAQPHQPAQLAQIAQSAQIEYPAQPGQPAQLAQAAPSGQRIKPVPAIGLSSLRRLYRPLWRAVEQWIEADGMRMSAAMSFYGILSLAPLLVLLVAVLGWWLDRSYIETSLVNQIRSVVGAQGAQVVQQAISSAQQPSQGITASVFAFVLLLSGATGVFAELQNAFERLWRKGSGEVLQQNGGMAHRCGCAVSPMFWPSDFCCWCRWRCQPFWAF